MTIKTERRSSYVLKVDITKLLEKEMDRKDFIVQTSLALVALTGISALLPTLVNQTSPTSTFKKGHSYGSSEYGGTES